MRLVSRRLYTSISGTLHSWRIAQIRRHAPSCCVGPARTSWQRSRGTYRTLWTWPGTWWWMLGWSPEEELSRWRSQWYVQCVGAVSNGYRVQSCPNSVEVLLLWFLSEFVFCWFIWKKKLELSRKFSSEGKIKLLSGWVYLLPTVNIFSALCFHNCHWSDHTLLYCWPLNTVKIENFTCE